MRGGLVYGVALFIVMNYLVVPLSAAWPPHPFTLRGLTHRFPPDKFVYNLLAMLLFGLIVAFYARYLGLRTTPRHGDPGPEEAGPAE